LALYIPTQRKTRLIRDKKQVFLFHICQPLDMLTEFFHDSLLHHYIFITWYRWRG